MASQEHVCDECCIPNASENRDDDDDDDDDASVFGLHLVIVLIRMTRLPTLPIQSSTKGKVWSMLGGVSLPSHLDLGSITTGGCDVVEIHGCELLGPLSENDGCCGKCKRQGMG